MREIHSVMVKLTDRGMHVICTVVLPVFPDKLKVKVKKSY